MLHITCQNLSRHAAGPTQFEEWETAKQGIDKVVTREKKT